MAQIPENINNAIREFVLELSKEIRVQKAKNKFFGKLQLEKIAQIGSCYE